MVGGVCLIVLGRRRRRRLPVIVSLKGSSQTISRSKEPDGRFKRRCPKIPPQPTDRDRVQERTQLFLSGVASEWEKSNGRMGLSRGRARERGERTRSTRNDFNGPGPLIKSYITTIVSSTSQRGTIVASGGEKCICRGATRVERPTVLRCDPFRGGKKWPPRRKC